MFFAWPACAQGGEAILFLVDGLGLQEIEEAETPFWDYLLEEGALGLVSTRLNGDTSGQGTYVYLATGRRPQSRDGFPIILERGEGEWLQAWGWQEKGLGEYLRRADLEAALISQREGVKGREPGSVIVVADQKGFVPKARLGELLGNAPWGALEVLDRDKIFKTLKLWGKPDFLFIETDDMARLERYRSLLPAEEYRLIRQKAISHIDGILEEIYQQQEMSEGDLFMVMVLKPDMETREGGGELGWLLVKGMGKGKLSSSSTRQLGLISLGDVFPTLLAFYGLEVPAGREGGVLKVEKGDGVLSKVLKKLSLFAAQYQNRVFFIQGFVGLQMLLILLSILSVAGRLPQEMNIILQYLHAAALLIPVYVLFFSPVTMPWVVLISSLGLGLIFYALLTRIFQTEVQEGLFLLLFSHGVFWFAMGWGGELFSFSLLGYSAVIGARFYGMGNEYTGFFLGSGIMGLLLLLEIYKRRKFLQPGLFLMAGGLGVPFLGANLGGLITALGISVLLLRRKELIILIVTVLFMLGVLIYEIRLQENASHLGTLLEALVLEKDTGYALAILERKILMNLRLWSWTPWARIFLLFIMGIIAVLRHPEGIWKKAARRLPTFWQGIGVLTVGSILALLVNDSGVVAAATTLYYPVHILFFFLMKEKMA